MGSAGQTFFGGSNNSQSSTSSSSNRAYPFLASQLGGPTTGLNSGMSYLGTLLGIPGLMTNGTAPAPTTGGTGGGSGGGGGGPTLAQIQAMRNDGIPGNYRTAMANYQANQGNTGNTTIPAPVPVTPGTPTGTPAATQGSALQNFSDSAGMKFLEDNGNRMINNNAAAKGMVQSGATLKGIEDYGQALHSTYLNNYLDKVLDFSKLGLGAANALGAAGSTSTSSGTGNGNSKPGILPGMQQASAAMAAAG